MEHHDDDASSPHVSEACEMISRQLGCDLAEARQRLAIRAASTGQALEYVALDVLDGIVRFDD